MANVLSRQPSLIPPDFGICLKSTISLAETALQLLKTHTVLAEEALYQASYGVLFLCAASNVAITTAG